MEKRYTFVINWKMFFDFNEVIDFVSKNLDRMIELSNLFDAEIILSPSFLEIYPLVKIFSKTKIKICAQNCSDHIKGPFTGQVCVKSLSTLGVYSGLIGHSEIRRYKSETNEMIARKFDLLLDFGITPILCIGESEKDNKSGDVFRVLEDQLSGPIKIVASGEKKINGRPIYVAYEPEWSIGTGVTPSLSQLESVFAWINNLVRRASPNSNWKFLYGGSVNPSVSVEISKIRFVNGFLIGRAGTNFEEFEKIVKSTILGVDG